LAKLYPNPKKLAANRVGPKIERLEALGFDGPRIASLKCIDDLRNAVAHRDREEVRAEDVASLKAKINELSGGRFSDEWKFTYGSKETTSTIEYSDMTLRQQFCLLSFLAIAALAAIPHELAVARGTQGRLA